MNRVARRGGITVLLVLLLLGGFVFFLCEYLAEAEDWVLFTGSPHVYNGLNIDCGTVTDRDGTLLLDMDGGRTYTTDTALRLSTIHWIGDRYGSISAPALTSYASKIAGYDLVNGVYNYGDSNGTVTLTFSAQVQKAALEAMGTYKGTVAVYNYKTGQLLCAVTTPTYDPDAVPDLQADTDGAYEGMYVNRFTQSTYIPGSIFKIVTLAAALETIPDITEQSFSCSGSYTIGADTITCDGEIHGKQTLKKAFRNSCNCAFAQVAQQLGGETLERYAQQFGVVESIFFDGITTAQGKFEAADTAQVNMAWSAIGQYNDQVNPCTFLNFIGAVANGGKGVLPYMVQQITVGQTQTYSAKTQECDRIMSVETAKTLLEYMAYNVEDKYGSENFPSMTVCAKTGTAEVGGERKPNAMLAGFVTDEQYPLAFIVCVEDAGYGKTVCIPIASKVLAACRETLDN